MPEPATPGVLAPPPRSAPVLAVPSPAELRLVPGAVPTSTGGCSQAAGAAAGAAPRATPGAASSAPPPAAVSPCALPPVAVAPTFTLWLNADRQDCPLPAAGALLLDALAASGIAVRLARRAWRDPALAGEPLLVGAGTLVGPLEIVHNGGLAAVGVAHLRVLPGDEVVIGQPAYLRRRFAYFH